MSKPRTSDASLAAALVFIAGTVAFLCIALPLAPVLWLYHRVVDKHDGEWLPR